MGRRPAARQPPHKGYVFFSTNHFLRGRRDSGEWLMPMMMAPKNIRSSSMDHFFRGRRRGFFNQQPEKMNADDDYFY